MVANLGNAATYTAFGRPLNVYVDLPLLRSIFHLLVGNVGQIWAFCAMLAGAAGLFLRLGSKRVPTGGGLAG